MNYTRAQIRYLSSLDPRDPDYLGPEDEDEDQDEDEDDMEEQEEQDDPNIDNPEDDYIMTDAENRGLL